MTNNNLGTVAETATLAERERCAVIARTADKSQAPDRIRSGAPASEALNRDAFHGSHAKILQKAWSTADAMVEDLRLADLASDPRAAWAGPVDRSAWWNFETFEASCRRAKIKVDNIQARLAGEWDATTATRLEEIEADRRLGISRH